MGDINCDGKINVTDCVLILKIASGKTQINAIADINNDGDVNPEDAEILSEYIAHINKKLS